MTISEIEEHKENLEFIEDKIISIEDIFKNKPKIVLNKRKLELFLNGVKLSTNEKEGVYRIYEERDFIGIGEVKEKLLKRDIVV
ncbi:MAG: tRNA pseudouridine(55) synthase TruB [Clostridia bacterium]|nr:tRNA pseudouridine(55) synthase TruB [Clostridia bacterium]